MFKRNFVIAALVVVAGVLMGAGTTYKYGPIRVCDGECPAFSTATGGGDLGVEGDLEVDGTATIEAMDVAIMASAFATIRFCGNGPNGSTPSYMGPVLLDDTEADLAFGGAGCDALDSATEATADAPWHAAFAFKPIAMVCVGLCTGATAANDPITFQLREDASDVTGLTCTTPALSGDAAPAQCSVRLTSPETVAAGSTLAVEMVMVDDDCNDAGDDFECHVIVTF